MKKLNKKGFTLVELLAVIVILALLMVVAVSTVGNVQENAKKNALKTEGQKILSTAYQDAQSAYMLNSADLTANSKFTGSAAAGYTWASNDGKYNFVVSASSTATISKICIDDGSRYKLEYDTSSQSGSPTISDGVTIEDIKDSYSSDKCQ